MPWVEAQALTGSGACALIFCLLAWTQVVPIGTILAYIVMLHGNVLLKQGLRTCKTVDGSGAVYHPRQPSARRPKSPLRKVGSNPNGGHAGRGSRRPQR